MSKLSRRRFLIIGGTGAIAIVAGGAALAIRQFSKSSGTLTFQAIAALPRPPLVSYATYVIQGQINPGSNTFKTAAGMSTPIPLTAAAQHLRIRLPNFRRNREGARHSRMAWSTPCGS